MQKCREPEDLVICTCQLSHSSRLLTNVQFCIMLNYILHLAHSSSYDLILFCMSNGYPSSKLIYCSLTKKILLEELGILDFCNTKDINTLMIVQLSHAASKLRAWVGYKRKQKPFDLYLN